MELPTLTIDGADGEDEEGVDACEVTLKKIWRDVIANAGGVPTRISRNSDFFAVGGNSLLILQLKAQIQQMFDVEISLPELFRTSTLQSLAARIQGSSEGAEGVEMDWEQESEPAGIPSTVLNNTTSFSRVLNTKTDLTILLTGASGFLGHALLRQLVASPNVRRIHCIAVRNPSRIPQELKIPKVIVHRGDLSQPFLGLPDKMTAAKVFAEVDAIVHNGAEVSHIQRYGSLRATNVGSTWELTRLLLQSHNQEKGIPAIHFVSTGGVATLTGLSSFPEATIPSHAVPAADGSHGYIASKWVGEKLLEKCAQRLPGLKVFIHRPSNITGEGVGSQDIVHNVLRFSKSLQAAPDLGADFGWFDLVGVDTAARNIVGDVLNYQASEDVTYRHQSGEIIVPANQLKEYLGHSESDPIRTLPMHEWIASAKASGMDELVASILMGSSSGIIMPFLEKQ